MTIPKSLMYAFESWDSQNRPPQSEFTWNPASWHRRFGKLSERPHPRVDLPNALTAIEEATSAIPDSQRRTIDREAVLKLSRPEILNPGGDGERHQAVTTSFIAAMIWGYGQVGYGPYRTERVLTESKDAVASLVDIADIAQNPTQGGLRAFESIAANRMSSPSGYLKYLGPAFGTKFLYFLTKATDDVDTTPVMDALVAKWFRQHAPEVKRFKLSSWNSSSYETYLASLRSWADELAQLRPGSEPLDLDDVELLIFSTTRDGSAGAWDSLIETDAVSVEVMLDTLASEAAERAGPRDTEGVDLIENLREWFAQHPE